MIELFGVSDEAYNGFMSDIYIEDDKREDVPFDIPSLRFTNKDLIKNHSKYIEEMTELVSDNYSVSI
ncbi:hypothetical protein HNQ56_004343 [Anaerotaenia torta]|uniref:hypothetical protein n=1 Tax=Anaerotaenia torta TaxID=433293 RepID=UPI003D1C015C